MYSQANVRAGKCAAAPARALPSVIVDTEKGVAGSGWVREAGRGKTAHGWKGVHPGGAPQKPDGDEPVRSPKNTSE